VRTVSVPDPRNIKPRRLLVNIPALKIPADVTIEPAGTFTSRLLVSGRVVGRRELDAFEGRWIAERGLVVSVIVGAVPQG
jgi:hypothetical protein